MEDIFTSLLTGEFQRKVAKKIERRCLFDKVYMKMAFAFSELSYARRHKVGCIIVSDDDQIISQGFNGTPSGFDNNCEDEICELCNKNFDELTTEDTEKCNHSGIYCAGCSHRILKTKNYVIHAEPNAITKCAKSHNSTVGATMYVTLSPCVDCAKLIIAAGIKRVVFAEDYHNPEGRELLEKANITVDQVDIRDEVNVHNG